MDLHMKSFHFETSKMETLEKETCNPINVLQENHDVHAHLEMNIEMDMWTTLSTISGFETFVCDSDFFFIQATK
jgi:hypothetical protein